MADCPYAALIWVPHASTAGTTGIVLCDREHTPDDDLQHGGEIGEYDADGQLIMLHPTIVDWHHADRRTYRTYGDAVVPLVCDWTDQQRRRCVLPTGHPGNHAP